MLLCTKYITVKGNYNYCEVPYQIPNTVSAMSDSTVKLLNIIFQKTLFQQENICNTVFEHVDMKSCCYLKVQAYFHTKNWLIKICHKIFITQANITNLHKDIYESMQIDTFSWYSHSTWHSAWHTFQLLWCQS